MSKKKVPYMSWRCQKCGIVVHTLMYPGPCSVCEHGQFIGIDEYVKGDGYKDEKHLLLLLHHHQEYIKNILKLVEDTKSYYKIRRISDGKYFGSNKWGETHNSVGKVYKKLAHVRAAITQADPKLDPQDHEIVEYKTFESCTVPLWEAIKK